MAIKCHILYVCIYVYTLNSFYSGVEKRLVNRTNFLLIKCKQIKYTESPRSTSDNYYFLLDDLLIKKIFTWFNIQILSLSRLAERAILAYGIMGYCYYWFTSLTVNPWQ